MISKLKFAKGNNSIKNVDGAIALLLCKSPAGALYSTKLHENISKGFTVIERTQFPN